MDNRKVFNLMNCIEQHENGNCGNCNKQCENKPRKVERIKAILNL